MLTAKYWYVVLIWKGVLDRPTGHSLAVVCETSKIGSEQLIPSTSWELKKALRMDRKLAKKVRAYCRAESGQRWTAKIVGRAALERLFIAQELVS